MKAIKKDGSCISMEYKITEEKDYKCVTVSGKFDFSDIANVEFDKVQTVTKKGGEGYFVVPRSSKSADYSLYYFGKHDESRSLLCEGLNMPIFGYKSDDECYIAVVSGMRHNFALRVDCENGVHTMCPIFQIREKPVYEDMKIEYFYLHGKEANYSGMARKYRQFIYANRNVKTLLQKIEQHCEVAYTAESVLVRIRCGWKPVPPNIVHQTRENEPEMHIACDFDKVSRLLDEFKAQGIEKAEFCLVGWNISGHDGRWPEAFPVEPKLGGEEKLRELIKKAQKMGYSMVCHTNHTDQYEIADCYNPENDCVLPSRKQPTYAKWSGGEMHSLCPKYGLENAKKMLPQVAALGFRGSHYIDVLGVLYPHICYSEKHPVDYKESVEYALEKCRIARELFGSVSSEGAYDFICEELDYGLYIAFAHDTKHDLCDESIPFWQIVYHGSVLSNPYTDTVNSAFKTKKEFLKSIEFGARPTFYYYSKFTSGNNWMGEIDCTCDNDEDMKNSVSKIKYAADMYKEMQDTVYAFIDDHEKLSDGVYKTTYSNGISVIVDYNNEKYEILR